MRKKEKHTRGPWLNWETLEWRHEPRKLLESTANALLIGAAPERGHGGRDSDIFYNLDDVAITLGDLRRAAAAIAKARGSS